MAESVAHIQTPTHTWRTRFLRLIFNIWPAIRGAGIRVTYIAPGLEEIRVKLLHTWGTYNLVGTIFGGSMYAACDPWFMVIMLRKMGPHYIVWDKSASIRFRRPGTRTLYASFRIEPEEVETIKTLLETEPSVERTYTVDLVDENGKVYATVEKLLYFRTESRDAQLHSPAARASMRYLSRV